jgi:molecular chaperone IbpA
MQHEKMFTGFPQLTSWVGFERLFDDLEKISKETVKKIPNWPPYNIKKIDDDKFVIEMAVAGFGKSDVEITTKDGVLTVKGEVNPDTSNNYLYKGIAERNFERNFTLADTVVVKNATMFNGLLNIYLSNLAKVSQITKIDISDGSVTQKQMLTE